MASVFSRIVSGDIPCIPVHDDEKTLAIMDINPIQSGQILVIPKLEVPSVWDLPAEDYAALMRTVYEAGRKLKAVFTEKKKVGVIIEGLEVEDHAHIKVFPFSSAEEFHKLPSKDDAPSPLELKELAQRLYF